MSLFKILAVASLSIGGILLFNGCSVMTKAAGAKGEKFTEFKKPKENHGMVYVYRPSIFFGSGMTYDIHVSDETNSDFIVGELLHNGYFEIDLPTGRTDIWAKVTADDSVELDIKNGAIYCIKTIAAPVNTTFAKDLSAGMSGESSYNPNFEIVDMATCKSEIIATRNSK